MNNRFARSMLPGGLLLLAVGLRVYGLDWGLPEVYEEATPLRRAWDMWGWDRQGDIDLNPHFFNYPSLSINLHFLWQGLTYLALRVAGMVSSSVDFQIMYLLEPTPIVLAGRVLSAAFGAGTVVVVYRLGSLIASRAAGAAAAFLLAVHAYHIDQSQQITVDIPLTFFAMASLLIILRLPVDPRVRSYLAAGAAVGLATATKYTGLVLVIPLVTAHLLAMKNAGPRWSGFGRLVAALGAAAAVFLVSSPFVALDFAAFRSHLAGEQQHMALGHFGLDTSPAWRYYLGRLGGPLAGWPALVLGVVALAGLCDGERRLPLIVVSAYLAAFLLPVSTWAMKADRYLLPAIPAICLLAGVGAARVAALAGRRWPARVVAPGLLVAMTLVMAINPARGLPALWTRSHPDTRTLARTWIEENLPAGTFVLVESYGPDLLKPADLLHLGEPARSRVLSPEAGRKVYAAQFLPMFQTRPERSAAYYDLELYRDAEYVVVSGSIRSRYARDPAAFPRQLAFYDELDARWPVVAKFEPAGNAGPALTIYRSAEERDTFAAQPAVYGPRRIAASSAGLYRDEGWFYFALGTVYHHFGYAAAALDAYRMGLAFGPPDPVIHRNLLLFSVQALLDLDQLDEARRLVHDLRRAGLPSALRGLPDELSDKIERAR